MSTRWSPLAGAAAIVCIVVAFAVGGGSVDTEDSDAKITAYFTSSSHQTQQIVALLVFAVGVLLLLAFFAVLRERVGGGPLLTSAGTASAVLLFLAVVCFAGPALAANDTSKFQTDPNTYRLINDMGYGFWVGGVMFGALVVWAASMSAAAVFPRWFSRAGIVVGVILLFALFWVPGFLYALWILVASILLVREPRVSAAAAPQPA
jgi:hypothetical protein